MKTKSMSPPIRLPALALALVSLTLSACRSAPVIPVRSDGERDHAIENVPSQETSELWVSYQIVIESIDGEATDYRAEAPCVYFKLTLPAGSHTLALRLDYHSPTHRVSTKVPVDLAVELAPASTYRLLDLSTRDLMRRSFTPHLFEGAPSTEVLELDSPR